MLTVGCLWSGPNWISPDQARSNHWYGREGCWCIPGEHPIWLWCPNPPQCLQTQQSCNPACGPSIKSHLHSVCPHQKHRSLLPYPSDWSDGQESFETGCFLWRSSPRSFRIQDVGPRIAISYSAYSCSDRIAKNILVFHAWPFIPKTFTFTHICVYTRIVIGGCL